MTSCQSCVRKCGSGFCVVRPFYGWIARRSLSEQCLCPRSRWLIQCECSPGCLSLWIHLVAELTCKPDEDATMWDANSLKVITPAGTAEPSNFLSPFFSFYLSFLLFTSVFLCDFLGAPANVDTIIIMLENNEAANGMAPRWAPVLSVAVLLQTGRRGEVTPSARQRKKDYRI